MPEGWPLNFARLESSRLSQRVSLQRFILASHDKHIIAYIHVRIKNKSKTDFLSSQANILEICNFQKKYMKFSLKDQSSRVIFFSNQNRFKSVNIKGTNFRFQKVGFKNGALIIWLWTFILIVTKSHSPTRRSDCPWNFSDSFRICRDLDA